MIGERRYSRRSYAVRRYFVEQPAQQERPDIKV
jgi:hypothetical protein